MSPTAANTADIPSSSGRRSPNWTIRPLLPAVAVAASPVEAEAGAAVPPPAVEQEESGDIFMIYEL